MLLETIAFVIQRKLRKLAVAMLRTIIMIQLRKRYIPTPAQSQWPITAGAEAQGCCARIVWVLKSYKPICICICICTWPVAIVHFHFHVTNGHATCDVDGAMRWRLRRFQEPCYEETIRHYLSRVILLF